MKKLNLLLFWCLLLGVLTSCDKDEDPQPIDSVALDYAPTSAGSTWNYAGTGTKPYTQTSLGTTKIINGKTFYEFENKQENNTIKAYLSKEDGVYTSLGQDPRGATLQMTFIKEHEPVGSSWEQVDVINGASTKSKFTLEGKGLTKTVARKDYKDVIHIKLESVYSIMGMEFPVTSHYFYAKGVGMILSDHGTIGTIELQSYTIK